jgi:hypothetical protein
MRAAPNLSKMSLDAREQKVNKRADFTTEADVLAFLVVLVLAVGGLLFWRAAPARPVRAAEACAPPVTPFGTRKRGRRRMISRGAGVRRSFFHASRAPGLLCERASPFISRHADGQARRSARIIAPAPDAVRLSPARC